MADPTFSSIARSLTVLLTDNALTEYEPFRNGLGLNNLLYVSMLIESFERRIAAGKTAGQLLLIEEPEAHLHPQLQRVLFDVLRNKTFQTILSTHSTHISSLAEMKSIVLLTNSGQPKTDTTTPGTNASLSENEISDLERYLDATRSTMLYARKVILVEGPAELFVIPPLVKAVLGIDLDRYGVSVVPIHGIHFAAYAKLFSSMGMPKKCAIIADGDCAPEGGDETEDNLDKGADLQKLANEYVGVFQCQTTFERAITQPGLLSPLAKAATELNLQKLNALLGKKIKERKETGKIPPLEDARELVLKSAKRVGKGRFAQVLSKHVTKATSIPEYIKNAIDWLELTK